MYRLIAIGLLLSTLIGGVYFKINTLNNKIDQLQKELVAKKTDITNLKLVNELSGVENKKLRGLIEQQNGVIEKNKIDYKKRVDKLIADLSKKPKVVYKTIYKKIYQVDKNGTQVDYGKATCEEGLNLNKAIANIKFEDL